MKNALVIYTTQLYGDNNKPFQGSLLNMIQFPSHFWFTHVGENFNTTPTLGSWTDAKVKHCQTCGWCMEADDGLLFCKKSRFGPLPQKTSPRSAASEGVFVLGEKPGGPWPPENLGIWVEGPIFNP